jgi:hypothetical protein
MSARRKSKKTYRNRRILILAALILIIAIGVFLFLAKAPEVVLLQKREFTVGQKVLLSDVVLDVKSGSLAVPQMELDSSKEGSQKVVFTVKNLLGFESEESFMIEWIPSEENSKAEESPKEETIEMPEEPKKEEVPITTTQPPKKEEPATNLAQGVSGAVLYQTENEIFIWQGDTIDLAAHLGGTISGSYSLNTPGTYSITVSKNGADGKETKKEMKFTVLASPFGEKGALIDGEYKTAKGFTIKVQNSTAYIDGILIANKSFSLPKSYTSSYLAPDAESAYYRMRDAASAEGVDISKIKSAYRSWNDQNYIFNGYVRDDSLENALTYSARPGHSEHQTGLGMDIVTSGTAESKLPEIATRLAWLKDNAHRFGFILRYPEGKTSITGYIFEPWHYRYVGEDLATKLYNGGNWITMEEYFGIDSIYRGY